MSNNYLQFSEVLDGLTKEEEEWAKKRLQEKTSKDDEDDWNFEWEICEKDSFINTRHISISSLESGSPEDVVEFVQEFLQKFRPHGFFSMSWACFCSRLNVGEFEGGAAFVTATDVNWMSSYDFIQTQRQAFMSKSFGKQIAAKVKK